MNDVLVLFSLVELTQLLKEALSCLPDDLKKRAEQAIKRAEMATE